MARGELLSLVEAALPAARGMDGHPGDQRRHRRPARAQRSASAAASGSTSRRSPPYLRAWMASRTGPLYVAHHSTWTSPAGIDDRHAERGASGLLEAPRGAAAGRPRRARRPHARSRAARRQEQVEQVRMRDGRARRFPRFTRAPSARCARVGLPRLLAGSKTNSSPAWTPKRARVPAGISMTPWAPRTGRTMPRQGGRCSRRHTARRLPSGASGRDEQGIDGEAHEHHVDARVGQVETLALGQAGAAHEPHEALPEGGAQREPLADERAVAARGAGAGRQGPARPCVTWV